MSWIVPELIVPVLVAIAVGGALGWWFGHQGIELLRSRLAEAETRRDELLAERELRETWVAQLEREYLAAKDRVAEREVRAAESHDRP